MQKVIEWRGHDLNQRTINAVLAAEQLLGWKVRITQGSYNKGGVTASAGTHDGGGALDIALKDAKTGELFPRVRREAIRDAFRRIGGAAWIRDPSQSDWPWHLHVIMQGDPDLSSGARNQVAQYKSGLNGLASRGRDDGPRTWVGVNFDAYLKAHPLPVDKPDTHQKTGLTVSEYTDLRDQINLRAAETKQEVKRQAVWMLRYLLQVTDDLKGASDIYTKAIADGQSPEAAAQAFQARLNSISADLAQRAAEIG